MSNHCMCVLPVCEESVWALDMDVWLSSTQQNVICCLAVKSQRQQQQKADKAVCVWKHNGWKWGQNEKENIKGFQKAGEINVLIHIKKISLDPTYSKRAQQQRQQGQRNNTREVALLRSLKWTPWYTEVQWVTLKGQCIKNKFILQSHIHLCCFNLFGGSFFFPLRQRWTKSTGVRDIKQKYVFEIQDFKYFCTLDKRPVTWSQCDQGSRSALPVIIKQLATFTQSILLLTLWE